MQRKTYISPAAWDALRMDYLAGHGTVRGLAGKHGINPGTAEQHAKRERWTAQRSEFLARKREWQSSPAPALPQVVSPPDGQLPPAAMPPDEPNFAALSKRFHALALPILDRLEEGLRELSLPASPAERLALANGVRSLAQTARELLGIPLVAPIKREERRVEVRRPARPVVIMGPEDSPSPEESPATIG